MPLEKEIDQSKRNLDAREKSFKDNFPKKLNESTDRFKKKIDNARCPCGEIHK